MTTLSTWRFPTVEGAEAALSGFERLQRREWVTVEDVAVVAWPAGASRPRTYQVGAATGGAALSGAFWGLLFGVVFLLPLAEDAAGGPRDAATDLSRVGVPAGFLQQLRDRIGPGTSALFLLAADDELDRLREALADGEADPAVSQLDREQDTALRRAFGAGDDLITR